MDLRRQRCGNNAPSRPCPSLIPANLLIYLPAPPFAPCTPGPCLSELSACIDHAGPSEVVCSQLCLDLANGPQQGLETVYESAENSAEGAAGMAARGAGAGLVVTAKAVVDDTANAAGDGRMYVVEAVSPPPPGAPAPSSLRLSSKKGLVSLLAGAEDVDDARDLVEEALEAFVPFPALNAVYADALDTMAELRQVRR